MYTKIAQAPFAVNIAPNEFVVRLENNKFVAVSARLSIEPNTGNPVAKARARVVQANGAPLLDSDGEPIESTFSHTSNRTEVLALGGPNALKRLMLLAVLGEDTAPLWKDPIFATFLEHASIRTNLNTAEVAGPVTNMGGLL